MNENYKCGMACLKEQIEEKRESLRGQAEAEREIFRQRQDIQKEMDGLALDINKLEEDSEFFKETLGLLFSYGGRAVPDPFAGEADPLRARRKALASQLGQMQAVDSESLKGTEAAIRRYAAGAGMISGRLESGEWPGKANGKETAELFEGNDILAYACRIACPEGRTTADFYREFLDSPEYRRIPEGRDKRCLDGILIRNLCVNNKEEAERWAGLPLNWDAGCSIGDEFTFAYRLKEQNLFSGLLFQVGVFLGKEYLFEYFRELTEGRIPAAADAVMRPAVETQLKSLLNPAENRDFFSDTEKLRQWEPSAVFREYWAIVQEELSRKEKKRRITNLLRMTLRDLIKENSFGEIEDEEGFIKLLTDRYFQGTLDAYLKEEHGAWNAGPSVVWDAVLRSPEVWAENEAWFEKLKTGDSSAVFRYFETGMYVGEQNLSRRAEVLEALRKMMTTRTADCVLYLDKLRKWKEERDFTLYEKQIALMQEEEAFRRNLRQSLVTIYGSSDLFAKAVSGVADQKGIAEKMADLYMEKRLDLWSGSWNIKSDALQFIGGGDGKGLIRDQKENAKRAQEERAQEKQRNKKLHRLRTGENLSKEDIYWYFDEGLDFQKPDKAINRVVREKLAEILNAELPASEETLGRLKKCMQHPNFQPFTVAVTEILQKNRPKLYARCRNELKKTFQEKLTGSAAEKTQVAEALANQYLTANFEQYMKAWSFGIAEIAGKAVKWLETEPAQNKVREEKEKIQQEIQRQEQENRQKEALRLKMIAERKKAEEERARLEREKQKEESRREADRKIRQKFDYIDLLLVLFGGTHHLLFRGCLFVAEVKGCIKYWDKDWWWCKIALFYAGRMALMCAAAAVYQAVGGYNIFSSTGGGGLRADLNGFMSLTFFGAVWLIGGAIPSILMVGAGKYIKSRLQKKPDHNNGGKKK